VPSFQYLRTAAELRRMPVVILPRISHTI
jgi:hypothetical protein